MKISLSELDSPLGTMLLVTDEREQVRALHFGDRMERLHRSLREHYRACELTDASARTAVADAIGSLLADPSRMQALGAEGRERVRTTHNWTCAAAQVDAALATLV